MGAVESSVDRHIVRVSDTDYGNTMVWGGLEILYQCADMAGGWIIHRLTILWASILSPFLTRYIVATEKMGKQTYNKVSAATKVFYEAGAEVSTKQPFPFSFQG